MKEQISLYEPLFYFKEKFERKILFSLAKWMNGAAFKSSDYSKKGLPIIKIAELKNGISNQTKFSDLSKKENYFIKKNDLLFSWSGQPETSIDIFLFANDEGLLNQHIYKIDPLEIDIRKDYFFYLMKYLKKNFIKIAKNKQTTGLGHVTKKDLEQIIVKFPSNKNEQKAIAHILGTLDEKIELNKKTNETLEDIAKSLFKSWFIDFDPVSAKAKGYSTGLSDDISNLFPDSFVDTEFGKIPKNWNVVDLQEIAEFQNGYAFKSKEYIEKSESSLEVFRMGYILRGGGFKEDNSPVFASTSSKGYQKKYALEKKDLTIAMTDMKDKMAILGCCALIEESNRFLLNQRVGRIRVKDCKIIDSEYLYLYMNYPKNIDQIRSKSNSGVQVNLSTDVIKNTQILIPEISLMGKFSEISNDLFSNIFKNNITMKTLVEIKDLLLPKLISGELRIRDAEKMIEEIGI